MIKRNTKDIIRIALEDAIAWNESLLDSIGPKDEHALYVQTLLNDFRKLLNRRYGVKLLRSEQADIEFMKTAKIINIIDQK